MAGMQGKNFDALTLMNHGSIVTRLPEVTYYGRAGGYAAQIEALGLTLDLELPRTSPAMRVGPISLTVRTDRSWNIETR